MIRPPEYRDSPIAEASRWVSRITSVALTMVLPAVGGYFLDKYMGSGPWMLLLGAGLGLVVAFTELLGLVSPRNQKPGSSRKPPDQGPR